MNTAAVAWLTLAAAALYLPSRIDTARANRRARQADAAHWNARIQRALEAGPLDEATPVFDRLVCEQLESQFDGGAR